MKTFLTWTFRVGAYFTAVILGIVWFASYGEQLNATQGFDAAAKLNKELIRIEGNRHGQFGENFSANGTYIGDATKVVVLVQASR